MVSALLALLAIGWGLTIGVGSIGRERDPLPRSPLASWRQDRGTELGMWFTLGGLTGGHLLRAGIRVNTVIGNPELHVATLILYAIGFLAGFVLGLNFPETWTLSLASLQLAIQQHTPRKLMWFLHDSQQRDILCATGPFYRFQYTRLQDFLAEQRASCPGLWRSRGGLPRSTGRTGSGTPSG